ncbi:Ig-like domain-containing protein [Shewanella baltica]|uniref:Ig domain protein group 1 domain protein n=1 Tax=Shewanella baltica (strain OS195) TaxID=399599 RepID=A9L071_SHEB9|nr:Ig-like domain-containing protein [Shewanella baltica]ABS06757.1 Ig domain protein group 1 domain protein [Shewanella baltica OS185]ABX47800.1 Ig domain protein group 1 domain protein [Shewanella baltica OS195]ADT92824.1 Ig domain protein group 1 domain protein [Shewanella baltica OS678]AEG09977.1 Ig domain protein group 1 domain protein [Shewanella baltica BA175]
MFYPGIKSYQALTAIYLVLLLALFGCGSDSDQDAAPTVTSTATTLAALNGIEVVQPGVLADIDLVNLVKANGKVVIKNVYTEQVRCPTPEVSVRGFNVYPQSGVACDYHYTVEAGSLQASARVTVLATRAENPIIPPLSHPMSLDSAGVAFDFDLVQLLGAEFPNGYNLTSVEMMPAQNGDAGQQGSVIFSGNTVTYTPPARIGFDGITYTLQQDGNPEFTVIGSIYITISNSPNEAPVIEFPNFSYQPTPGFIARAEYSIDLAQAGMTISVANGKEYHLQHVQSPTATVSHYDNAANNKRIRFQAATPGEHLVSYIVADDFGGFTMGFIKVQVDAVLNPVTWSDLEIEGRTFTAPVLYTPQLTNMFNAIPVWDDSVNNNTIPVTTVTGWTSGAATVFGNTLAAFRSYSAAQAYCGTRGGRLPSYDESLVIEGLQVGVDEFGLINTAPGWPKGRPYALMVNGAEPAGFPWERGAYVTCVKHTAMELDLVATEFERFARDSGALLSQELGTLTTEFPMQQITHKIIGGSLMNYPESIVIERLSDGNRHHRITAQASRNGYATIRFYDTINPKNYIDTPMLRFLSIDVLDTDGRKLLTGSPSKLNVAILQRESTNTIVTANVDRHDINTGFYYGAFLLSSGQKVCQLYNDVTLYGRSNWVMSTYSELRSIAAHGDMNALGWPTVQYYKSGDSCAPNNQQHFYIDGRGKLAGNGCYAAESYYSFISCSSDLPVDNDKSTIAVIFNNALANNTVTNQVSVTVRDANNAPVAGQEVIFNASNNATVVTQTVLTDGNGVAIASIRSPQSGISTVTASFNGTTKTVDVTFNCQSLAGACIDIFDTGSGKLFTNSPSVAYLNSIGGSAADGTYTETGTNGPAGGTFYIFNWNNAKALCDTYSANVLGGRTNWRLATKDELKVELFSTHSPMFKARGWPTYDGYWSLTPVPGSPNYYDVSLNDGNFYSSNPIYTDYASCVSVP